MNSLPPDMLNEIGKYLERRDQPAIRRVNRDFSQIPFDWDQCCSLPTNIEIARYLYNHRTEPIDISALFAKQKYTLSIDKSRYMTTGEFTVDKSKNGQYNPENVYWYDVDDILDAIAGYHLELKGYLSETNWNLIRNILADRISCIKHGYNSDACYIKLLSEYLTTNKIGVLDTLPRLIHPRVAKELKRFEDLIRFERDPQKLKDYFLLVRDWILQRKPQDLKE